MKKHYTLSITFIIAISFFVQAQTDIESLFINSVDATVYNRGSMFSEGNIISDYNLENQKVQSMLQGNGLAD